MPAADSPRAFAFNKLSGYVFLSRDCAVHEGIGLYVFCAVIDFLPSSESSDHLRRNPHQSLVRRY